MAETPLYGYEMAVTTFDGASPFEDFEQEIGALLRARPGLGEQQRKDLIIRHLGRDVRSELACQTEQETAQDLLKLLKAIYGDKRPLNALALEFYGCRQGTYETLRHYSHRLNKAFGVLKSGHNRDNAGPVPDVLLRDQFVAGLRSEGLRLHLVQHRLSSDATSFLDIRTSPSGCQAKRSDTTLQIVRSRTHMLLCPALPHHLSRLCPTLHIHLSRPFPTPSRQSLRPSCS